MHTLTKTLLFIVTLVAPGAALLAGDYVWEEKFRTTLPKAEQGDSESQYAIGEMYERGRGPERDAGKAFSWYSKAASQGNAKAAYKVGLAYLEGEGVKSSAENAYIWFKKSAENSYARAQFYLGELYAEGKGTTRDLAEAAKWYKKALEGGYADAASRLDDVSNVHADAERRAETERRLQQAKQKAAEQKNIVTPKAAEDKHPVASTKSTKEKLLAGGWKEKDKPAENLPSAINPCEDKGVTLECLSKEQTRVIGAASVTTVTKSIIFGMKDDGQFQVSYRHNVVKVTVNDPEKTGITAPVKEGWQEAEHFLKCSFDDDTTLNCEKDKIRMVTYTRE